MKQAEALKNYAATRKAIGYVERQKAKPKDYKRIGFKSGLEVHQQLKTKSKLFCRCPAGIYHSDDDFDAEVIRHMRPTLSELGEYDGTALMEFKTRKNITYRLNNRSACTYEVDDTPPFHIDPEALEIAIEISLLSKLNIVGEVHITRKQYLDGSIPTGFQRTAILGVEGEIQLKNKKVGLIQLSIEEDSCREISDIGHERIYKTDRLGMPLIETVTQPELETPDELAEAAEYIRFLNRSTDKVRTGMGAGREDVNVSCAGGSRVEIKGVAHNKWIPELSHNEAFRQWALLNIKRLIHDRGIQQNKWVMSHKEIDYSMPELLASPLREKLNRRMKVIAINLPKLKGILSHFMQPGHSFAHEISHRLKVIACIERPNMTHSESFNPLLSDEELGKISKWLGAKKDDAQIVLWGPAEDIPTALETVEERIRMAFEGVPEETRKSLPDGTTIFERVLPGSDRMYPDTDSAPIPLTVEFIDKLGKNLPPDIADRYAQMKAWGIPSDTWKYLLSKNMVPLIEKICEGHGYTHKFIGSFLGHTFKNIEGKRELHKNFFYEKTYELFRYIKEKKLEPGIAKYMMPVIYEFPDMQFSSVLTSIQFRQRSMTDIITPIKFLHEKYLENTPEVKPGDDINWLMGQVHHQAIGNVEMADLRQKIGTIIK
ncbi:MAG: Glu-tRNA(Gln) amidotransferase subunit GatE [Candidatus Marinimicrobia bacterium]|nr:Glu-tRNA(Gln) amidotransferase subunit GatE [Candidatus Neomarinimicrobiota bacterium]